MVMRTLGEEALRIAGRLAKSRRFTQPEKERKERLGAQDIVELVFIDAPANDRSRLVSSTREPATTLNARDKGEEPAGGSSGTIKRPHAL